jgi:hypothetical protein
MLMPHSYQILREEVSIDAFASRAALLNRKKGIYRVFLDQVRIEGAYSLTEFENALKNAASELSGLEVQDIFEMEVIPELITQKSGF